jgi:hypothetical protein
MPSSPFVPQFPFGNASTHLRNFIPHHPQLKTICAVPRPDYGKDPIAVRTRFRAANAPKDFFISSTSLQQK